MNTIDAFEKDILLQLDFLRSFENQNTLSSKTQKNTLFTGSGDSLVSAMLTESFSDGKISAIDPLDLYRNRHLVKTKHVYFVSISGNTITNIRVAKISKHSIAVTSNPDSRLAKAADDLILLKAPNNDVFTAGSISFLESALTCISIASPVKIPRNSRLFNIARTHAKKIKLSKRIFVLGNLFTFPMAMYCAAKIYEVLGYDAHYCRIEQFSHMELFSAKKGDTIIILEQKNSHSQQLAKHLKKSGFNVVHPLIPSKKISQIIYCAFFSQLIALYEARKKRQKDCYFVTAKKIRNISNEMIY